MKTVQRVYLSTLQYLITECLKLTLRDIFHIFYNIYYSVKKKEFPQTHSISVLGHLQKPSIQAIIHGLNRHYYSIPINFRKNKLEQQMLMNLHKKNWNDGLALADYRGLMQIVFKKLFSKNFCAFMNPFSP